VLGALVGAGCAPQRAAMPAGAPREAFAAAGRLLSGLDPQEPGGAWRPGDSVLLGVSLADGRGPERESYIRVTVAEPMRAGNESFTLRDHADFTMKPKNGDPGYTLRAEFDLVMLLVETFDERGEPMSRTTALMPEPCMRYGLTEFIGLEQETDPFGKRSGPIVNGVAAATPDQVRVMAGWLALVRLPEFMRREKTVNGIVQTVIRPPGLGSILRHMGVSVSLGLDPEKAEPAAPPAPWVGAAYRVPLDVLTNGARATDCELTVTSADPPLGPCNGLLALEASRPDDPGRKLSVRLLAARRGRGAG